MYYEVKFVLICIIVNSLQDRKGETFFVFLYIPYSDSLHKRWTKLNIIAMFQVISGQKLMFKASNFNRCFEFELIHAQSLVIICCAFFEKLSCVLFLAFCFRN